MTIIHSTLFSSGWLWRPEDHYLQRNLKEITIHATLLYPTEQTILYNIAQVMLNDGDEVIFLHTYWVSYFEIVKLSEVFPLKYPTSIRH
jgi:aspartate/methionine/tyrosine aminotransferase